MAMRRTRFILLFLSGISLIGISVWLFVKFQRPSSSFDGQRAYKDVLAQMELGPRITGSTAHSEAIKYIQAELKHAGWNSELQQTTWSGFQVQNIIATRSDAVPQIIIGAHYDSRMLADQDASPQPGAAVPGANDGASGVAILLELARSLPANITPTTLVFIDAEDNGGIGGQDWLMGSRAYVASLTFRPRAVVILDMVGDANLDIYMERNSDPSLTSAIWAQAEALGYQKQFIPAQKYSMLDDHTPFIEAGIPAVDIIDFDYPYWHTSADTADKVSPGSLQIVGETIRAWLIAQQ
jgi:glutaminyl-peptide cyclotransferase